MRPGSGQGQVRQWVSPGPLGYLGAGPTSGHRMPSPPALGPQAHTGCRSKDPGHGDRRESHDPGRLSSPPNFLGSRAGRLMDDGVVCSRPHPLLPNGKGWGVCPHKAGRSKPAQASEIHMLPAACTQHPSFIHSFTLPSDPCHFFSPGTLSWTQDGAARSAMEVEPRTPREGPTPSRRRGLSSTTGIGLGRPAGRRGHWSPEARPWGPSLEQRGQKKDPGPS